MINQIKQEGTPAKTSRPSSPSFIQKLREQNKQLQMAVSELKLLFHRKENE